MMNKIINILSGTPWWVYIVFCYVLYVGFKASKPRTVHLYQIFILPSVFGIWSLMNFIRIWNGSLIQLAWWIGMLTLGLILGYPLHKGQDITIDKKTKLVKLPGTWATLILVLSIFVVKYYFGYSCATAASTHLCHIYALQSSVFSICVSGVLASDAIHTAMVYLKKR